MIKGKAKPLTEIQKQIVIDNLYLIKYSKLEYYSRHTILTKNELFSAAALGLIKAIQNYVEDLDIDPHNIRWRAYLKRYMNGYMLKEIKTNQLIILPNYLLKKSYRKIIQQRKEDYYNNVVSDTKNYDKLLWLYVERVWNNYVDYPFNLMTKKYDNENDIEIYKVINYFGFFTERERQIILLVLEGYTFSQIAKILGMTAWGCRLSYKKSLNKIKKLI
jgi:RNA polymerase sigma factor (sigma-70 family)